MQIIVYCIYSILGICVIVISYFSLRGTIFSFSEKPERIMGKTVRLHHIESGLKGLDPDASELPYAKINSCLGDEYRIDFERSFQWLGKTESLALVSARHKGYPISKSSKRGFLAVNGKFGSGEPFIGLINLV
jgi:hypothetical protein